MGLTLAAVATTLALGTPGLGVTGIYDTAPVPHVVGDSTPDWTAYVPVLASAVVPGSGQFLQGELGKGILHLGFGAACLAAIQFGGTGTNGTMKLVGGIGLIGIGLWSPWDAWTTATQPPEAAQ